MEENKQEITEVKETKSKKKDPLERFITKEQASVIEKNFRKSAYFLKIMNILIIIEIVLSIFMLMLIKTTEGNWATILTIVVLSVIGAGIIAMFLVVLFLHLNFKKYLKSINVDYKEFKKALKS